MMASTSGMVADTGRTASLLLGKHIRTLEVLHSLQKENARLRKNLEDVPNEESIETRIAEAIAVAVAGPNDLAEELHDHVQRLQKRASDLQAEVSSVKEASSRILEDANQQREGLRQEKNQLEARCSDLEAEVRRRHTNSLGQESLKYQLHELTSSLTAEAERVDNLVEQIRGQEANTKHLLLNLKEKEDRILIMETDSKVNVASLQQSCTRIAELEKQVQYLKRQMEGGEAKKKKMNSDLDKAMQELKKAHEESAIWQAREHEISALRAGETERADGAEARFVEERRRLRKLKEEGQKRLEEEKNKCKQAMVSYALKEEELLSRIKALSEEARNLQAQVGNNKSPFGKYVEVKTENTNLKEELDELKAMLAVSRASPHTSKKSIAGSNSKQYQASVMRLRHSISAIRSGSGPVGVTMSGPQNSWGGVPVSSERSRIPPRETVSVVPGKPFLGRKESYKGRTELAPSHEQTQTTGRGDQRSARGNLSSERREGGGREAWLGQENDGCRDMGRGDAYAPQAQVF